MSGLSSPRRSARVTDRSGPVITVSSGQQSGVGPSVCCRGPSRRLRTEVSRHEIIKMDSKRQPAVNILLGTLTMWVFSLVHKEMCGAVMQVVVRTLPDLVGLCCLRELEPESWSCFS